MYPHGSHLRAKEHRHIPDKGKVGGMFTFIIFDNQDSPSSEFVQRFLLLVSSAVTIQPSDTNTGTPRLFQSVLQPTL